MVQTEIGTNMMKVKQRALTTRSIREACTELRKQGYVWVKKGQFELSLASQIGVSVRKVREYLSALENDGYLGIDLKEDDIYLKKKLDHA